jgi:hypothetical protein
VESDDASPALFVEGNIDNLRWDNGHLYFRDMDANRIEQRWVMGMQLGFDSPIEAESFDIQNSLMAIIEAGTNEVWLYDIVTRQLERTGIRGAYAHTMREGAFVVYYDDARVSRWVATTIEVETDEDAEDTYEEAE